MGKQFWGCEQTEKIVLDFRMRALVLEMIRAARRKKGMLAVLAGSVVWICLSVLISVALFWSCEAHSRYPGQCKKKSRVFLILGALGLFRAPAHRRDGERVPRKYRDPCPVWRKHEMKRWKTLMSRDAHREKERQWCPIPLVDSPYRVQMPTLQNTGHYPFNLTYMLAEKAVGAHQTLQPLFGGYQTCEQREESFKIKPQMKVHCGFIEKSGGDIDDSDGHYLKKCRFLVASGIFDNYDQPHQPSNISLLSQKIFCFVMVVDAKSLESIERGANFTQDRHGGKWVGLWRLLVLQNLPYDEPRRNGKVPKLLIHRLFPETQYSIWIDGKMELVIDPLLILERYLWRGQHKFAIAQHKHHRSIYQEAEANKRRKRYARPLIDRHMKLYHHEGMRPWGEEKLPLPSDVPEGAIIIREHTPLTNLFSCLWFNEVNRFTPRDQLSFGYVVYRLNGSFPFFMFPNCEYNSLTVLHKHTREHSSKVEWVKSFDQLKGGNVMLETRGGIGLWTPDMAVDSLASSNTQAP